MNSLPCQAEPDIGSGPCRFVAVRTVNGLIPPDGYPDDQPLGRYRPGDPITTFTCAVHLEGVEEAMRFLGLIDVYSDTLPQQLWRDDGQVQ